MLSAVGTYTMSATPPNDQKGWHWLEVTRPAMIETEPGPKFHGLPERWIDNPR